MMTTKKRLVCLAALTLIVLSGCSSWQRIVYRPDINQGNYLNSNDVAKLKVGMTKQQIIFTLGTPMLTDPFGSDTWFYIFRRELGRAKPTQQTLTLHFDQQGKLSKIDNQPEKTV